MMNKIIRALFLVIITGASIFSQWNTVYPVFPIYQGSWGFSDLQFLDAFEGYAIDGGRLITTTDGGESWKYLPQISRARKVFFVDKNYGFVLFTDSLYVTTDGGTNWTHRSFGTSASGENIIVRRIFFIDKNTGYGLTLHSLIKTIDSGSTWYNLNLPTPPPIGSFMHFTSADTGFYFTERDIFKTTDGGSSWHSKYNDSINVPGFYSVSFINADTGFVSRNGVLLKTVDGGDTWTAFSTAIKAYTLCFINSKIGYARQFSSNLYKTEDGGLTWRELHISSYPDITGMQFINADTGYIVSESYGSVLKTTDGGNNWTDTDQSFHHKMFFKINKAENGAMYLAGSNGLILRSYDGFSTREKLNTGTTRNIGNIHFINKDTGYAVTNAHWQNGEILKTTDAGNTWSKLSSTKYEYYNFCFTDANTVYVAAMELDTLYPAAFRLLKSSDGCNSFTTLNLTAEDQRIILPFFTDKNIGYTAIGSSIFKTSDAGLNWTKIADREGFYINHILFTSTTTGFAAGWENFILKTTDAGESWNPVSLGSNFEIETIYFINEKIGFVAGMGKILKTIDGGESWHELALDDEYFTFKSMYFENEEMGYVCGSGFLLKTTNGGGPFVTDVKFSEGAVPENFELMQNYPNPFNPVTTISYSIPEQALVELKVFDMLGREVITLINKEQNAGKYNVEFDGSSLPSGVYIYNINAGNFKSSRKLVLLK